MGVQGSGVWGLGFKVHVWGIGVFSIGSFPGHHTAGYQGIFSLILTEDPLPYPKESPSHRYWLGHRMELWSIPSWVCNKFFLSPLRRKGSGKAERGVFSRGGGVPVGSGMRTKV